MRYLGSRGGIALIRQCTLGALLAGTPGTMAHGQTGTTSGASGLALTAQQPGMIRVTVLAGDVQSIPALVPNAVNPFPAPARVNVQWNLAPNSGRIALVASFATRAQALTNGTSNIPSTRVQARMLTGAVRTWAAINANGVGGVGTPGASRVLWRYRVCNSTACRVRSRTDNLELRLNLVGLPTTSGTYTGVLTLRAVTY
jgi:hypothetical protein